jgi:anti-sigma factor ChrR (cupin superfamily)
VEIAHLYGDGPRHPGAALLRYAPGARVPRHEHVGYELIHVLSGWQADERRRYDAGTLFVHPPGTRHEVVSPEGCLVLAVWQAGVEPKP